MRHFAHLSPLRDKATFHALPDPFFPDSPPDVLALALGALLYMPATKQGIAAALPRLAVRGLTSAVLCLEDAVPDQLVGQAEDSAVAALQALSRVHGQGAEVPLVFVRIRAAEQIPRLVERLGPQADALCGFALPKFAGHRSESQLAAVRDAANTLGHPIYALPILETAEVARRELRAEALHDVRDTLAPYRDLILTIRIGATDLSAVYGLRRGPGTTIYDIAVLRDIVADVVSAFGGSSDGYPISGPVWEYFAGPRLLRPALRTTPFAALGAEGLATRQELLDADLDGLLHETLLDRANGLIGKTVIHPSHVLPVNAVQVVSHEEYLDAQQILAAGGDSGVASSAYGTRMNEMRPHAPWAQRTLDRARVYGVLRADATPVDLLEGG